MSRAVLKGKSVSLKGPDKRNCQAPSVLSLNNETRQKANGPDDTCYEDILNGPMFNIPADIGATNTGYEEYPDQNHDGLGASQLDPPGPGPNLPPDLEPQIEEDPITEDPIVSEAAEAIGQAITATIAENLFGDPVTAYYMLFDHMTEESPPETLKFIQQVADWTKAYINELPDRAFAVIEPDYASGKSKDKNARHLPHHNANVAASEKPTPTGAVDGKSIDLPHLRNALARVSQIKPVTDSIAKDQLVSRAKSHLDKHAKALKIGDDNKEESNDMSKQVKAGMPLSEGPNDQDTFPKTAPPPNWQPPGSKIGGPSTEGGNPDTYKQTDDQEIPKGAPKETYTPPGTKIGGPNTEGGDPTTYKQTDDQTFPEGAPPGAGETFKPSAPSLSKDLSLIPIGPMSPEQERHQPYLREKKGQNGPSPPWEGYSQESGWPNYGHDVMYQKDDGHLKGVETSAMSVDLYHQRFQKKGNMADLIKMASYFGDEKGCMGVFCGCTAHEDSQKVYARDMYAYSYAELNRSVKKALRQFTNQQDEPDMEMYQSLMTIKADLNSESSRRYLNSSRTNVPVVLANYMTCDDDGDDDEPGGNGNSTPDKKGDSVKSEQGGNDEMKADAVREAIGIGFAMLSSGTTMSQEAFADQVIELAEASAEERKRLVATIQRLSGAPVGAVQNANDQRPAPKTNAEVVERNLIAAGIRDIPGTGNSGKKMSAASEMALSMFSGGKFSPMAGS